MSRQRILLGPQNYRGKHAAAALQICVNLYAEEAPPGADVNYSLMFLPGTDPWLEVGSGDIRGYHVFLEFLWVVSGNTLYKIEETGQITALGTIPGQTNELVWMEDNGLQLLIVTGASDTYKGYFTDGTANAAAVTDPDFPQAAWAVFMDQQVIVGVVNEQEIQWSAVADVTAWDALDIATAENAPDKLRRGLRNHNDLLLFGAGTLEIWYNSGDAEATFTRASDGVVDIGCAAARSPALLDNHAYFLAIDKGGYSVRRLEGRTPVKVSHHGVDADLGRASTVADAIGYAFTLRGHAFYVLTLRTAQQTHVYDLSTKLWFSWKSAGIGHWRPLGVVECFGRLLVIDSLTPQIGRLNDAGSREFDTQIPWEVTGAPLTSKLRTGVVNAFELEVETGTALRSGQGSNPYLFLSWSDNNGKSWGNFKRKGIGKTGTHKILRWNRLGSGEKRLFRLHGAEPIDTGLIQAFVEALVSP